MNIALAILIAVVIAAVIALVVFYFWRKQRRSEELRNRFGPEYAETVQRVGDQRKAEKVLDERVRRVEKIDIRPLSADARRDFAGSWDDIQAKFVDDPAGAFRGADALIQRVMQQRGYPMGDFDQRAEDISVDHPTVVSNYRRAHDIYLREQTGEASTDDLRRGFQHYRELFRELLEPGDASDPSASDTGRRFRTA